MDGVEAEGRTVNEATDKALQELGLSRDLVEVEVLSQGRPRLLGFRGEPARVRVTPLPERAAPVVAARPVREMAPPDEDDEDDDEEYEDDEDDEADEDELEDADEDDEEYDDEEEEEELPAVARRDPVPAPTPVPMDEATVVVAVGVLENLINLMGLDASVSSRAPETAGDGLGLIEAVLDVDGDDLGLLIGRRGQTLASLQYILNLIVSKQTDRRVSFGVDVDGYRRRREEALISLARRTAARVRSTGHSVTLEPMPPNERRIIHITLAEDAGVMTVSIGEGDARKVAITPTR